ncbi:MAG: hypothetical protein GXP25_22435 [Planctomycetes bacterium]|nr:hypothetical protein [Planctomycetota bacterium]
MAAATQKTRLIEQARQELKGLVSQHEIEREDVLLEVKPLDRTQAIGDAARADLPLVTGEENLIEAHIMGNRGQAYTDSRSHFRGSLRSVLFLPLDTNYQRSILLATLNAACAHFKLVDAVVHCVEDEPDKCGREMALSVRKAHGDVTIGVIGYNPAIAEHLVDSFGAHKVKIADLRPQHIGKTKFNVEIWDANTRSNELVEGADAVLLTGTTLVWNTADEIIDRCNELNRPHYFFGVTAAAVSHLCGIDRMCPFGRT